MKITIIFPIILTIIIVESLSGFLHVKKQRQGFLHVKKTTPGIIVYFSKIAYYHSFKNHVYKNIPKLIGGLELWNFMTFHSVGNVIIPTDLLTPSFFRRVGSQPATRFCGWS